MKIMGLAAYNVAGPRPTSSLSGILIHLPFGHNRRGPKMGLCPFGDGELGPHLTQCGLGWAEAYLRTKWHLDRSSRLAIIDMDRKVCPILAGGVGSTSNTVSRGPKPTSVRSDILTDPALWPQQTWTENGEVGCAPLGLGSWIPI